MLNIIYRFRSEFLKTEKGLKERHEHEVIEVKVPSITSNGALHLLRM